jgi:hypothetical protein
MPIFLRATALCAACAIGLPSLGCTILGAGIGATIPRMSDVETPAQIESVPRGSDVRVVYFRPIDDRGGGRMQLEGTYRGTEDGRAVIERGDKSFLVPLYRIEDTRARLRTGSYATEGALAGAAVDVTLLVISVWYVARGGFGRN